MPALPLPAYSRLPGALARYDGSMSRRMRRLLAVVVLLTGCGSQSEPESPAQFAYASRVAWEAMYPEAADVRQAAWITGQRAGNEAWEVIFPEAATERVGADRDNWETKHPAAAAASRLAREAARAAHDAAWRAKYPGAADARNEWRNWTASFPDVAAEWGRLIAPIAEASIRRWEAVNDYPPPGSRGVAVLPQSRRNAWLRAFKSAQRAAALATWESATTSYPEAATAAPRRWPPQRDGDVGGRLAEDAGA